MKLRLEDPDALETVRPQARALVEDHLRGVAALWREVVAGGTPLW